MSRETLLAQLQAQDLEDGTAPLPEHDGERRKTAKTLADLAQLLAAMNEREAAAAAPRVTRGAMSVKQKSQYIAEHGSEEYLRLPE